MSIKGVLEWLKQTVGEQVAMLILSRILTKDNITKFLDDILDSAENWAEKTDTKLDDAILKKIREALQIPDNDEPKVEIKETIN